MTTKQGDVSLLNHPVAQEMLHSINLAELAYVWHDGTPRVVPIWFTWTGEEVVFASPPNAPKMHSQLSGARVAISISSSTPPYKALTIRGTAKVETVKGMVPEYAQSAERYFGPEQGKGWTAQVAAITDSMVRIAVKPDWVGVLDFTTGRLPNAIEELMEKAAAKK